MGQVTIQVNGRPYTVGCEDGQEAHLTELARMFDSQVRQVSEEIGQLGDTRLFLMAALLMADDIVELRSRVATVQAELARAQSAHARMESKATALLENAAKRIENLAL